MKKLPQSDSIVRSDRYHCLVLDPPWKESGGGKIKRGADRHYPLMRTKDMPKAIYQSGVWNPADNAHMYMYVTKNFLKDGIWLMEALGFRFVSMLVWVKVRNNDKAYKQVLKLLEEGSSVNDAFSAVVQKGIGQYFRGGFEPVLFGVRGSGPAVRKVRPKGSAALSDVIIAPRSTHSSKPDVARKLFMERSHGPYLEMFAREPCEGWTVWGNEV